MTIVARERLASILGSEAPAAAPSVQLNAEPGELHLEVDGLGGLKLPVLPPRADDDWSIKLADGCTCELCRTLGTFLEDPVRRIVEWPLAEQRRRHIHSRIDAAELPVRHRTRRKGRPYTLVLTKSPDIFELERLTRNRDEADLEWLIAEWNLAR